MARHWLRFREGLERFPRVAIVGRVHPSESSSLQLSVRAALDEAIDDANLSGLGQEIGSADERVT